MDLELRLRASLVAPDPGPPFTDRVMARIARSFARRRRGFVLAGTVLVMATAAAVLTWRPAETAPVAIEVAAAPTAPTAPPPPERMEEASPLQPAPEAGDPVAPAPRTHPVPEEEPAQYSVLVMPLKHEASSVAERRAADAFHAAMIDELRNTPGLALQVLADPAGAAGRQADYVLTLTGLATSIAPTGGVVVHATSRRYCSTGGPEFACATPPRSGNVQRWDIGYDRDPASGVSSRFHGAGPGDVAAWVELEVEPRQAPPSRYIWPVGAGDAAVPQRCEGPMAGVSADCMSPAQRASNQIELLRLQVFPPDVELQQRVIARMGDASQSVAGLLLYDLTNGFARDHSRLDAGSINALAAFAAGQPANTRAMLWQQLGAAPNPAMVAPLIEVLRHDPDQQVRLAALANLEANHSGDPLVRSALQRLDRDEPEGPVRAAVRAALYGPVQWREDVMAALGDATLPYEGRVAPVIANRSASARQQVERRAVLKEPQILQPLVQLIGEHASDPAHSMTTANVLMMLGSVEDPLVTELFLQLMGKTLPVQVSGAVGTWAINHRNDPRVRESLPLMEHTLPSGLLERMEQLTGGAPAGLPATQ